MIKAGIIGGAGYTAGELIRLLINHPDVEIKFINSSSNAGNKITDVHEGLYGETDLVFTDELPLDTIDVLFFCTAHGDTRKFMESHNVPEDLKIIDLSMDYRIKDDSHDFVYGLPELNRRTICHSKHVANPGCFATCIQLGLLPLAKHLMLNDDVMVNAITGSTGAGVKPGATSHFSWRNNNMSVYKAFEHQVHVVNRLTACSFQQVVDAGNDEQLVTVLFQMNQTLVGVDYLFQVDVLFYDVSEGILCVIVLIYFYEFIQFHFSLDNESCKDTSCEVAAVGDEINFRVEAVLQLAE